MYANNQHKLMLRRITKIFYSYLVFLLLSGCACSIFARTEGYHLKNELKNNKRKRSKGTMFVLGNIPNEEVVLYKKNGTSIKVKINQEIAGEAYSVMIFPIVPLPPIIPLFGDLKRKTVFKESSECFFENTKVFIEINTKEKNYKKFLDGIYSSHIFFKADNNQIIRPIDKKWNFKKKNKKIVEIEYPISCRNLDKAELIIRNIFIDNEKIEPIKIKFKKENNYLLGFGYLTNN